MSTLEDQATRAADELLSQARSRPLPTIEALTARSTQRRPAWVGIGAAAAVLALAALSFVAVRGDGGNGRPGTVLMPSGVEPKTYAPAGLGASMQVPSDWEETPPASGFLYSITGPDQCCFVLSGVVPRGTRTPDAYLARRVEYLRSLGATIDSTDKATVDGLPAHMLRYRLPHPGLDGVRVIDTEYDIDLGNSRSLIIVVGEREPATHADLLDWITSTITVQPTDYARPNPIAHPTTALPVPTRITPKLYAPEGLGATVEMPSTWSESSEAATLGGTRHGANGRGPSGFILADRVTSPRLAYIEAMSNVHVQAAIDTTIDGYPARISRFTISDSAGRLALDTAYEIQLDPNDYIFLTFGESAPGVHQDVVYWMRSTIKIL